MLMIWIAFFIFPYSKNKGTVKFKYGEKEKTKNNFTRKCWCCDYNPKR